MNSSVKTLILTAAVTGLFGGTSARLNAQPATQPNGQASVSASSNVGTAVHLKSNFQDTGKHSCKGKNDCKGQGGCKSSDNGCKGKNSCKGKGGCATDGSKMPKK
ncbi:MAG TPA: hypothetical protein VGM02_12350 [Acidobacteriaceae bacterium]|jgi:hypothetical protein